MAVVGGGSAGYAAARTAASEGLRTVLIEGAQQMGGLCILRGCMPSKALLWAAEVRHLARLGPVWGLHPHTPGFDWEAVMARKDRMIREFAEYRVQQLTSGKFKLLRAHARFTDPETLRLDDGGEVRAKHFVIATGSVNGIPPLSSLGDVGVITSDDVLEFRRLPRSIIVLGGGAIALELAQLLVRFDVEVTLIQRSPQLLSSTDHDLAAVVEKVLRREGIRVFTGTELLEAGRREDGLRTVAFRHENGRREVAAEQILLALGRRPNTESLGLETAGVATHAGRIVTDDQMRTTAKHIFAAGDCTGPHDIVHIAIQQAEIAAHNIAHPEAPRTIDYRLLTKVIFTDPQVATVGLTEKEATAAGRPALSATHQFDDHGKSLLMEARDGFVKLLADPVTGEILGGACVGPLAGELIHEIIAAMHKRMTVRELAVMPHYHPTLAEIWTYPAETLAEQIVTGSAPWRANPER